MRGSALLKLIVRLGVMCTLSHVAIGEELPGEWTEVDKQTALYGCQMGVLTPAFRDYLLRQGWTADKIPENPFDVISADQRDQAIAQMIKEATHVLKICECVIEIFSKEIPLSEIQANPTGLNAKAAEVIASGRCVMEDGQRDRRPVTPVAEGSGKPSGH